MFCRNRQRHHGPLYLLWAVLLSVPFYFLWRHLAPVYLPNLPPALLRPPLLDCTGAFLTVAIVRSLLFG